MENIIDLLKQMKEKLDIIAKESKELEELAKIVESELDKPQN
jgi:hypothetical protein